MTKADRLYKLSQGSDTAIWACDEVLMQDERIAYLEKELDKHRGGFVACMTGKQFTSHNLEQQVKGIEDALSEWTDGDSRNIYDYMKDRIKSLKEKSNEFI